MFQDLPNLRIFRVWMSRVSAEDFGDILETLPAIEELEISQRGHFATLERISNPDRLREIDADEVSGAGLDEEPLSADELIPLQRFENLKSVKFSLVHLASDVLTPLGECPSLEELDVSNVNWPDPDLSVLPSMSSLESLTIRTDARVSATSFSHLAELENLRIFRCRDTKIGATGSKAVAELDNLEELRVAEFGDKDLERIAGLAKLRKLYIHKTKITDEGVEAYLSSMSNLEVLSIRKAKITDAAIASLPRQLKELELVAIKELTEASVETLMEFDQLETLTFADGPRGLTEQLESAMKKEDVGFSSYAF